MIADKLPADFGQVRALKQDRELAKWAQRQAGKYRVCGVCDVPIRAATFEDHVAETHFTTEEARRARAVRR